MRRSKNADRAMRLGLFVLALVGLPAATSLAAITVDPIANDVSPDPATWTIGTMAYIGTTADGKLTVDGGSQINSFYSYFGYNSGATGTATVTGTGSKWTTSGELYVGKYGTGTLTVADGGQVTAKTIYASVGDLHGNGTINANGIVSDVDLIFDQTHGLTQALSFGSGGTLNLTMNGGSGLGVGYKGTGTLRIADGQVISSTGGYLGYNYSSGTAIITGAGSKWMSAAFYVGNSGTGTLKIENGGIVSSGWSYVVSSGSTHILSGTGDSYLGYNSGSTGTVTVTGAGSKWDNDKSLYVGCSGTGTLTIENGGTVRSSGYSPLGYNSGSTGTVTVTGIGSKWINNTTITVGYSGIGTLNIENGGTVISGTSSSASSLGFDSGSTGTATVTGTGSKWVNSGGFYLGYYGNGTLSIENGGTVTSSYAYFGFNSGSTGRVTITGTGSNWTSGWLDIGQGGMGTLNIENGGEVTSSYAYLGHNSSLMGTATVTGPGSKWTTSSLYVGDSGHGMLNIENGGTVTTSGSAYLGRNTGSTGTVTVTGIGSKWITSSLSVGSSGAVGTLNVSNGGTVTCSSSSGVSWLGNHSSAIVTGSGSKWTNSGLLHINGTLIIENGGEVTSSSSYLDYNSGSTGTATVTGSGSKWTSGSLYVGNSGTGQLAITRGGLVTAQNVSINNSQSLLSLDIGFGSTLNINNGTGTLTNNGTVRFTAGASVAAGEYQPILAGTFTGSGIYQALGGRWDNTHHVFIVDAAETGNIHDSINLDLTASRRAAITDATSGQTLVGASFLSGTGSISFAADELTGSEESALFLMLTDGSDLLAGYQFTVTGTTIDSTNPVYLSLFVGRDYDEDTFKLWHYDGTAWTAFLPTDLSYDGLFASFTVTGFSGYAISGELIPEPASLGLLAISSVVLLMRRPRIS